MTNELCTNMRNQHLLCISHQMLLCLSIIIMVSSFIQVKWKTTPKKTQQQQKQINKQTKKQKKKTKNKQNDIM